MDSCGFIKLDGFAASVRFLFGQGSLLHEAVSGHPS